MQHRLSKEAKEAKGSSGSWFDWHNNPANYFQSTAEAQARIEKEFRNRRLVSVSDGIFEIEGLIEFQFRFQYEYTTSLGHLAWKDRP